MYLTVFIPVRYPIVLNGLLSRGSLVLVRVSSCSFDVLSATGYFLSDQLGGGGYLESKGGAASHTASHSATSLLVWNILWAP